MKFSPHIFIMATLLYTPLILTKDPGAITENPFCRQGKQCRLPSEHDIEQALRPLYQQPEIVTFLLRIKSDTNDTIQPYSYVERAIRAYALQSGVLNKFLPVLDALRDIFQQLEQAPVKEPQRTYGQQAAYATMLNQWLINRVIPHFNTLKEQKVLFLKTSFFDPLTASGKVMRTVVAFVNGVLPLEHALINLMAEQDLKSLRFHVQETSNASEKQQLKDKIMRLMGEAAKTRDLPIFSVIFPDFGRLHGEQLKTFQQNFMFTQKELTPLREKIQALRNDYGRKATQLEKELKKKFLTDKGGQKRLKQLQAAYSTLNLMYERVDKAMQDLARS